MASKKLFTEIFSLSGPTQTTSPHKTWLNMLTYPSPKSVHLETQVKHLLPGGGFMQLPRDTVNSVSQVNHDSSGLVASLCPLSPTLKFSNFSWIVIWKFRDLDSTLRDCYSTGLSHGLGICMFLSTSWFLGSIALDLTRPWEHWPTFHFTGNIP